MKVWPFLEKNGRMSMNYNHEEEKMLVGAKKRDRFREKLSQGKRWRAEEDADRLVDESISMQKKTDDELDRKQRVVGRDGAMNTAIEGTRKDMSIRRFVL